MEKPVREVEILADSQSLALRAVRSFVEMAQEADRKGCPFTVALPGGSTPRQMYTLLAEAPFTGQIPWRLVHIFWGDERCVPPEHADSNYRMVQEPLIRHVPIPMENIHRIHGEIPACQAAEVYEGELRKFFGTSIPRFDLILLGLGDDGHTASLFPGDLALQESTLWALPVTHNMPPPPVVDRVTLTLPVLNAAAAVIFLVSGAGKAGRLAQVLQGARLPVLLPAQMVNPVEGRLLWLADRDAAGQLTPLDLHSRLSYN
jgi:6-phosphogluconolactonase